MRGLHYVESGLDDVWLLNGFRVEVFEGYGEAIGVNERPNLWRLLGRHIARQDRRMNGQELRFLRALLDWSQTEVGRRLGYADHQMVAKWEKAEHGPIPIPADLLLRACYLESIKEKPMVAQISRRLAEIADRAPPPPQRRVLRRTAAGVWEAQQLPREMEFRRGSGSKQLSAPARRAA